MELVNYIALPLAHNVNSWREQYIKLLFQLRASNGERIPLYFLSEDLKLFFYDLMLSQQVSIMKFYWAISRVRWFSFL